MSRLVRVTIWYETDCLLLGHDRFMKVTNVVKTPPFGGRFRGHGDTHACQGDLLG